MQIDLERDTFAPGETISGYITGRQNRNAGSVQVQIRSLESTVHQSSARVYAEAVIELDSAAENRALPFSLVLPNSASRGFSVRQSRLSWCVEAKTDGQGPDARSRQAFTVTAYPANLPLSSYPLSASRGALPPPQLKRLSKRGSLLRPAALVAVGISVLMILFSLLGPGIPYLFIGMVTSVLLVSLGLLLAQRWSAPPGDISLEIENPVVRAGETVSAAISVNTPASLVAALTCEVITKKRIRKKHGHTYVDSLITVGEEVRPLVSGYQTVEFAIGSDKAGTYYGTTVTMFYRIQIRRASSHGLPVRLDDQVWAPVLVVA